MQPKAASISACVFVMTPTSQVLVDGAWTADNLTEQEVQAFDLAQRGLYLAWQENGFEKVPYYDADWQDYYTVNICPFDYLDNSQVAADVGIYQFPAILFTGFYYNEASGEFVQNQYVQKKTAQDYFSLQWDEKYIQKIWEALIFNKTGKPSEGSIVCKLVPPLCKIGLYGWAGLTALCGWNAITAENERRQLIYSAAFLATLSEFNAKGGIKQLFPTESYTAASKIGKLYDDIVLQPGTRVDEYWKGFQINPSDLGVKKYSEKQYYTPSEAIKTFNLYSIEFGNWMSQADRAEFHYATMVTLRDMAKVLGLPMVAMGKNKMLSLAFGSRGKGGFVAAFYQPYIKLINLTKTNGRHSFCHEYGHFIDYSFGSTSLTNSNGNSEAEILMSEILQAVLYDAEGNPTSYKRWLSKKNSRYYSKPVEIWARICETFFTIEFERLGIKNTWGVSGTYDHDLPEAGLIEPITQKIKRIFKIALTQ